MSNRKTHITIIFSFVILIVSISGSADSHTSNDTYVISEKSDVGLWEKEDCKEISDAAGFFLYMSGVLLKVIDEKKEGEDDYNEKESDDEIYESILFFTNLAATYADVYETFCKR